jgi:TPR repeat protein
MYVLAMIYFDGVQVPKDTKQAAAWYTKALLAGHDDGLKLLSLLHAQSQPVPPDPSDAAAFYRRAATLAEKGPLQMELLGMCYAQGMGVRKNLKEAIRWYRRAADAGNADAMFALSKCYAESAGASGEGMREAAQWALRAAKANNAEGMLMAGACYTMGLHGLPVDQVKAARWYRRAAQLGNVDGMYTHALLLLRGSGCERDPVRAIGWLERAIAGGKVPAMNELGKCYDDGIGVAMDIRTATLWYLRAARGGYADAFMRVGLSYELGRGVRADPARAAYWYERCMATGRADAIARLGSLYESGRGVPARDPVRAVALYRQSIALDAPAYDWPMIRLGLCLAHGIGVARNPAEAVTWFERAAQRGSPLGSACLAVAYELGEGVPRDGVRALDLYHMAADEECTTAMVNLGDCYALGAATAVRSDTMALGWYRRAALLCDPYGLVRVGEWCEYGYGGAPRDLAEALSLYLHALAIDADNAEAWQRATALAALGVWPRGPPHTDAFISFLPPCNSRSITPIRAGPVHP